MVRGGLWNLVLNIWLSLKLWGVCTCYKERQLHSSYNAMAVTVVVNMGWHVSEFIQGHKEKKLNLTTEILCYFYRPHEILAIYRMKGGSHRLLTVNACEWLILTCASSLLCWLTITQELCFTVYIMAFLWQVHCSFLPSLGLLHLLQTS